MGIADVINRCESCGISYRYSPQGAPYCSVSCASRGQQAQGIADFSKAMNKAVADAQRGCLLDGIGAVKVTSEGVEAVIEKPARPAPVVGQVWRWISGDEGVLTLRARENRGSVVVWLDEDDFPWRGESFTNGTLEYVRGPAEPAVAATCGAADPEGKGLRCGLNPGHDKDHKDGTWGWSVKAPCCGNTGLVDDGPADDRGRTPQKACPGCVDCMRKEVETAMRKLGETMHQDAAKPLVRICKACEWAESDCRCQKTGLAETFAPAMRKAGELSARDLYKLVAGNPSRPAPAGITAAQVSDWAKPRREPWRRGESEQPTGVTEAELERLAAGPWRRK